MGLCPREEVMVAQCGSWEAYLLLDAAGGRSHSPGVGASARRNWPRGAVSRAAHAGPSLSSRRWAGLSKPSSNGVSLGPIPRVPTTNSYHHQTSQQYLKSRIQGLSILEPVALHQIAVRQSYRHLHFRTTVSLPARCPAPGCMCVCGFP